MRRYAHASDVELRKQGWHSILGANGFTKEKVVASRSALASDAVKPIVMSITFGMFGNAQHPDPVNRYDFCRRCHAQENREPGPNDHEWSDWQYDGPGSCEQTRTCLRCGIEERQQPEQDEHDWADWEYANDSSCQEFVRSCERCGQQEHRTESQSQHDWDDWQDKPNGVQKHTCRHCGHSQVRVPHIRLN